jgi:hypothetical protein
VGTFARESKREGRFVLLTERSFFTVSIFTLAVFGEGCRIAAAVRGGGGVVGTLSHDSNRDGRYRLLTDKFMPVTCKFSK